MVNNLNNNYWIKFTPFLLVFLNVILKIIFISSNSIGGDEPFSMYHAQLDTSAIIKMLYSENNPPLHFFFLQNWIKLFGISAFSVRLPSLIFSAFTVLYLYKIGKEYFTFRIAILISLIFTFSNYHLAFAHEARVYSLFALLTAMSMYYFLKVCNEQKNFKSIIFFLIINALLIYAHYFGFFVIAIQSIAVLFIRDIRIKIFRNYVFYSVGLILLYIPNLNILIKRFSFSTSHKTWVSPPNGLVSLYDMLWHFCNKPVTTVFALLIIISALIKVLYKKDFKIIHLNIKVMVIWFLFPFLFMFIISYWVPMFLDRYLIFVSLGYYLVLAVCANYIVENGKYKFIIPGFLVASFLITFNPNVDNKRHVKETVAKIIELKTPKTKVLICPQHFIYNFAYYYNPKIFKGTDLQYPSLKMTNNLIKQNIYTITNINEVDLDGSERIVFLDAAANFSFPENNIFNTLEKLYTLKNKYEFPEIFTIYEFVKK